MARPFKRTDERADKIAEYLRAGNTRRTSCICSGISEDTFARWAAADPAFAAKVAEAEEFAVARNVAIINKAAMDSWQAAAWFLERRRHADWGKLDKLQINVSDLSDERLIALLEKTARGRGEAEGADPVSVEDQAEGA